MSALVVQSLDYVFFFYLNHTWNSPEFPVLTECQGGQPQETRYIYVTGHIIWIPKCSTALLSQSWLRAPFWLTLIARRHTHWPPLPRREPWPYSMPNMPSEQQNMARWTYSARDMFGEGNPSLLPEHKQTGEHCNTEKWVSMVCMYCIKYYTDSNSVFIHMWAYL